MALEFSCISHYELLHKIAVGGMGSIYLARQCSYRGFQKTVAIKIVDPSIANNPDAVDRFIGEANLVSDLVHENILQVYNLGKDEVLHQDRYRDIFFIVMEFVHGKALDEFMDAHAIRGRLPDPKIAAFIASRVCRALHYAHAKTDHSGVPLGIVHRDVTPQNIICDYRGVVKLADFGIAKAVTTSMPDEHRFLMGKLNFFAPEQLSLEPSGPFTDIYALGLVLYLLLTGTNTFSANSIDEQREQVKKPIPSPARLNTNVDSTLGDIVMRCLQPRPEDRFPSAGDLGQALEHFLYDRGYGPTNETLAAYLRELFPEDCKKCIGESYARTDKGTTLL